MSALEKINSQEIFDAIQNASFDSDQEIKITTTKGDINLNLFATKTPATVANFFE